MKKTGQIVLFRFPQTDLNEGSLRPALLLGRLPGEYDDRLDFRKKVVSRETQSVTLDRSLLNLNRDHIILKSNEGGTAVG